MHSLHLILVTSFGIATASAFSAQSRVLWTQRLRHERSGRSPTSAVGRFVGYNTLPKECSIGDSHLSLYFATLLFGLPSRLCTRLCTRLLPLLLIGNCSCEGGVGREQGRFSPTTTVTLVDLSLYPDIRGDPGSWYYVTSSP
jgi:hypothetical protein